jgi:hypothetical protein
MGCYGKTILFSLGDCGSKNKSVTNLSVNSLNQSVKEAQIKVNQSARTSTVTVQNQKVTLDKFPAGTADIRISQGMKLKVASTTEMKSTVKKSSMDELVNSLTTQMNDSLKLESDIGADATTQEKINNVKKSIISVVKSTATLKSAQDAAAEVVSVNNQEIFISFADFNSDMLQAIVERFKTPGSSGAIPQIVINQDFLGDVQLQSTLSAVAEAISQDKQVNKAETELITDLAAKGLGLAGFGVQAVKEASVVLQKATEEAGKLGGKVVDTAGKIAEKGIDTAGSIARTWIIIVGLIVVAVIVGVVFFSKSLFSNPEAMKTLSSMTPAGKLGGAASALRSPAPSAPSMSASVPKAAFGFGSCGYRFR